jgi:hypothetical protein
MRGVRFWPKADMAAGAADVCFRDESGREAGQIWTSGFDPKRISAPAWIGNRFYLHRNFRLGKGPHFNKSGSGRDR